MKQSHLITPRSLSECSFTTGYISYEPRRNGISPRAIGIVLCIALTVIAFWR